MSFSVSLGVVKSAPAALSMTLRSKTIPIALASPGMILAAAVTDSLGQTLVAEGSEISAGGLAGLRRHGVAAITYLEEDTRTEEELLAERNRVTQQIMERFAHSEKSSSMAFLQQIILEYRLERLS